MRYLITILAISAFALMAGSAQAYDDQIGPYSDTDLPVWSENTVPQGIYSRVSWRIDYECNPLQGGRTIVHIMIDNTDVDGSCADERLDSSSEDCGETYKVGSGWITGTPLQSGLVLDSKQKTTGHFSEMYLEYTRF